MIHDFLIFVFEVHVTSALIWGWIRLICLQRKMEKTFCFVFYSDVNWGWGIWGDGMDNLVVNLKYLTPTPTIKCNGGIEVCEGGE